MICREKDVGGLGIRDLKTFNYALLEKWLWRLKTEGDSLWVRVLREKYGVETGAVNEGGSRESKWWRDLHNLENENSGLKHNWFTDMVKKEVGSGNNTFF